MKKNYYNSSHLVHEPHALIGTLWKVFSCFCFAGVNGMLKSIPLPACQLACLQNLLGAVVMAGSLRYFPLLILKRPLYWIRSLASLMGALLWIYALRNMPIFQAVAMGFLTPFFTITGASLVLKEKLTPLKSLSIALAIAGGIVANYRINFFACSEINLFYLTLPAMAAALFASVNLMSKYLVKESSPEALSFSLLATVGMGLLFTLPSWVWPTSSQWIHLIILGILMAGALWGLHQAMKYTELSFLIPVGSVKIFASALIGWFFFNEKPTQCMWIGSVLILLALSLLYYKRSKNSHSY
jgi:drug/metabolite transporter (DMT)-like permease